MKEETCIFHQQLHSLFLHSSPQLTLPAKPPRKPWPENESPPIAMSVSCSNCFPDDDDSFLLCGEDSSGIIDSSPECSSDLDSPPPSEAEAESIAGFIEDERNFVPGFEYLNRFQSRSLDASAREESVAWILKVTNSNSNSNSPTLTLFFKSHTLLHSYYDFATRVEYRTGRC